MYFAEYILEYKIIVLFFPLLPFVNRRKNIFSLMPSILYYITTVSFSQTHWLSQSLKPHRQALTLFSVGGSWIPFLLAISDVLLFLTQVLPSLNSSDFMVFWGEGIVDGNNQKKKKKIREGVKKCHFFFLIELTSYLFFVLKIHMLYTLLIHSRAKATWFKAIIMIRCLFW